MCLQIHMESLAGLAKVAPTVVCPLLPWTSAKKRIHVCKAKLSDDNDPLFKAAVSRALLRFQETRCPEPLFIDPYAGCFVPPNIKEELKNHMHHYCLATKFIDEELLSRINIIDGLKQVVLFTDGMDTRPYRLRWPTSTMIYDISPDIVFRRASQMLEDVGAKITRSCLLFHIPLESSNIQQILRSKGFSGNRPSIWIFQGLPMETLSCFEEILFTVSNLGMKGCFFMGELPACFVEAEVGIESSTKRQMEKLFMSNGFQVEIMSYNKVAKCHGRELDSEDHGNILFVAEHLRFSDDQMEIWRREFQRMEDEGDEEGFEEL